MTNKHTFFVGNYRRISATQQVSVAPITIIIGNNSSGKSSVVDAIRDYRNMVARSSTAIYADSVSPSRELSFASIVRSGDTINGLELGHLSPDGYGVAFTLSNLRDGAIGPRHVRLFAAGMEIFNLWHEYRDDWLFETPMLSIDEDGYPDFQGEFSTSTAHILRIEPNVANLTRLFTLTTPGSQNLPASEHLKFANALHAGSYHFGIDWTDVSRNIESHCRRVVIDLNENSDRVPFAFSYATIEYSERGILFESIPDLSPILLHGKTFGGTGIVADFPPLALHYLFSASLSQFAFPSRTTHLPELRLRTSRYVDPSYPYNLDWYVRGGQFYKLLRTSESVRDRVNAWFKEAGGTFRSYEYRVINLVDRDGRSHEQSSNALLTQMNIAPSSTDENRSYFEQRLALWDDAGGLYVGLDEVGTGISQVTPVLAMLYGEKNTLLQIEQPELHLHPRLQSRLADAMADSIALGNTVMVETHSEHLILRLLHLIRHQTPIPALGRALQPDDIQIIFVEGDGAQSKIIPIDVTPSGNLSRPWPNGFFDESMD